MLPATHGSVVLLLIIALLCLGGCVNTFKAVAGRWRFELFALDFSAGALAFMLLVAYTLGTMGPDLGFGDRILVAGRTAQALAVVAGAVFNLGSMLLLASVSLLGISIAVPFTIAVALIVNTSLHFRQDNVIYLIAGILAMCGAGMFELRAAHLRASAAPAKKEADLPVGVSTRPAPPKTGGPPGLPWSTGVKPPNRAPKRTMSLRAVRGLTAAIMAGVPLGFFVPILENCVPGDLGLGGYASMVLFAVGMLGSTIVYDFYFLNIAVEGPPMTFAAFFRGRAANHVMGALGGAICIAGLLAATLALASPVSTDVRPTLRMLLPLLSVPLAVLCGATIWKELAIPRKPKANVITGLLLFLCGLCLLSFGFAAH